MIPRDDTDATQFTVVLKMNAALVCTTVDMKRGYIFHMLERVAKRICEVCEKETGQEWPKVSEIIFYPIKENTDGN